MRTLSLCVWAKLMPWSFLFKWLGWYSRFEQLNYVWQNVISGDFELTVAKSQSLDHCGIIDPWKSVVKYPLSKYASDLVDTFTEVFLPCDNACVLRSVGGPVWQLIRVQAGVNVVWQFLVGSVVWCLLDVNHFSSLVFMYGKKQSAEQGQEQQQKQQ